MKQFISKFTDEEPEYVTIRNTYYLKNPFLEEIRNKVNRRIDHLSIPLGEGKKKFKPSLYLLEWLSHRTKEKVYVNKKAEWLYLCGRDLFSDSIEKDTSKERLVLVQNNIDENIGYGLKQGKKIKNLLDRGDFLRRER